MPRTTPSLATRRLLMLSRTAHLDLVRLVQVVSNLLKFHRRRRLPRCTTGCCAAMAIVLVCDNMRILGRYDRAKTPALLRNTSRLCLANRLIFFGWPSPKRATRARAAASRRRTSAFAARARASAASRRRTSGLCLFFSVTVGPSTRLRVPREDAQAATKSGSQAPERSRALSTRLGT